MFLVTLFGIFLFLTSLMNASNEFSKMTDLDINKLLYVRFQMISGIFITMGSLLIKYPIM